MLQKAYRNNIKTLHIYNKNWKRLLEIHQKKQFLNYIHKKPLTTINSSKIISYEKSNESENIIFTLLYGVPGKDNSNNRHFSFPNDVPFKNYLGGGLGGKENVHTHTIVHYGYFIRNRHVIYKNLIYIFCRRKPKYELLAYIQTTGHFRIQFPTQG